MLLSMFVQIKCTNRGEECLREKEREKKRKVKRERIICRRFAC